METYIEGNLGQALTVLPKKYWENERLGVSVFQNRYKDSLKINRPLKPNQHDLEKKIKKIIYPAWVFVENNSIDQGKNANDCSADFVTNALFQISISLVLPKKGPGLGSRSRNKSPLVKNKNVGMDLASIGNDLFALTSECKKLDVGYNWLPSDFSFNLEIAQKAIAHSILSFENAFESSKTISMLKYLNVIGVFGKGREDIIYHALLKDLATITPAVHQRSARFVNVVKKVKKLDEKTLWMIAKKTIRRDRY